MSEATAAAEEENKKKTREEVKPPLISHNLEPSSSSAAAVAALMDLDFADLEPSWPFDQIPTSPVLISAVDQPFSPLWAFADASDDRNFRISADFSCISTCNLDSAAQNIRQQEQEKDVDDNNNNNDNNNKKKLPAPFLGFTPLENLDLSCIMKERMTKALRVFREMSEQNQILAQIWAPVKNGNRCFLTTAGQPFVLGPHSHGLNHYRAVSLMYKFAVDGEFNAALGLPGRVFRQKLPEWTPNVQYYSSKEYPRVIHAKNHNVRGTLALPVFEPLGQSCIGVLELIMTSEKINYAPEVDKVCKALEAVNLKSSEILDHPNIQICNEGRQNALAEILDVLTAICETYKLPLAQTWIPCMHRSVLANGGGLKKSCSSFDGSCMGQVCMSTTDVALYVVDARMWGFRDACAEHHLQKGQGVVGRAFLSHGLCFCRDISLFRKIEYPLVHYARMFKLTSSFAICLRSRHTGDDDYVLEFFLPPSVTDNNEQLNMVDCILSTMKQDLQNLMVASGRTLEEERRCMEIVEVSMDENRDFEDESILSSKPLHDTDAMTVMLPQLNSPQQLQMETDPGKSVIGVRGSQNGKTYAENKETKKTSERKRGKAEKQISLEVLQQYFAGSLKDAAKALGVCPTTMKRICRQHGISRWPSRKINKVNRSLTKLKRVIESVQGADAAFSLTSLAPPTIPGPVGPVSWPAGLNGSGTCQEQSPLSYLSDPADEASELPHAKPKSNELTNGRASSHEERTHEPNGFVSKTSPCSREVSTGTSTSHGSCYGSPGTESNLQNGQFIPNFHEHTTNNGNGLMFQPKGEPQLSPGYSVPDPFLGENPNPQELFGGMLVEDAGSSKDLKNLCPLAANANVDEAFREPRWTNHPPTPSPKVAMSATGMAPRFPPQNDTKVVTIKATFREDIIRFRFSLSSNIVELREEVAKRLKLEVGTFEIKYLDDDHEWVLIAYDSHLQECLDISNSSGNNMIRLLIQDISGHIGSSCESSGDRDGF